MAGEREGELTRETRGGGEGARGDVGAEDGGGSASAEERAEDGGHCEVLVVLVLRGEMGNNFVMAGRAGRCRSASRCNEMRCAGQARNLPNETREEPKGRDSGEGRLKVPMSGR